MSVRAPRSADDDFVHMTRARFLVPGRGGFGELAAACASGTLVRVR